MFFSWKDQYSVGIDEIDFEHRLLIKIIDDLYQAIHDNRSSEAVVSLFSRLQDYTKAHFGTEQAMMQEAGYARLGEHQQEHEGFLAQLAELKSKHARGRLGSLAPLVVCLRDWLDSHICKTDREMAKSLLKQNAGQQP